MERKELAAWSLIAVAIISGSLTASSIAGCKPNSSVSDSDLDLEVDAGVLDSNVTASAETPISLASEVPAEAADAEPVGSKPALTEPSTTSNDILAPPASAAKSASPEAMLAAAAPAAVGNKSAAASESGTDSSADIGDIDDPTKVLEAGGDWPQWGGTRWKNNAPGVTGLPESWKPGKFDRKTGAWDKSLSENIRWVSNLGSQTYGNPVIANGKVYVGTNNGAGHLARYPSETDLGCLLCFDEKTGELLWQHSSEKLITGRVHDWPLQGVCCSPLVEGDRLWFVTSRGEVRCLDTKGFHDDEDNGPFKDEPARVVDMEVANPAYKETLAKLDEGQVSDALKALLESRGEPVSGDVEVASVAAGKVWNLTGRLVV